MLGYWLTVEHIIVIEWFVDVVYWWFNDVIAVVTQVAAASCSYSDRVSSNNNQVL